MKSPRFSFLFAAFILLAVSQRIFSQQAPSSWSIVASYTIPGKASGLAWDGTYIYSGIYGVNGNQVYKFNPSNGTSVLQCSGPFEDAYGLSFKSPNLLTVKQPSSSSQPSSIIEFSMAGAQVNSITLPDHYMSGVAYDNGTYWVGTYYPDPGMIYHVNSSGTILSQFAPPGAQTWDICMQGNDLWIADYYGNTLYKVSNTGSLIESHPSQSVNPSGIVWDGNYLWYCDGQLGSSSTLYKVDLSGSGTPAINIPVNSHNYGTVTIGNSSAWNCQVQNTGTANLVINAVNIPSGQGVSTGFNTPTTITPGNSVNIPLVYSPLSMGPLNAVVTILSNDPIHPSVNVTLTGQAVYAGPHIELSDDSHDYGERRAGAYSRWLLPVANMGNQALSLTQGTFSDEHFFFDESVIFPISVATLETAYLGVWFHPAEASTYPSTLYLYSNDAHQSPVQIEFTGTGVVENYPIGTSLWHYTINSSFDNSPKAIYPITDITGDSVEDVIIASEDNTIRCFNGNASGVGDVLWATNIPSGAVYQQNALTTIPDINLDGYEDVIAGTAWGDCSIVALSGKAGTQIWKHDTHEYGNGGWVYQVNAEYDYNNDGFPDVLAATGDDGNGTGPKRVYCLNGHTGVPLWKTVTTGPLFSVIGIEDFTGEGKPDVLAGGSNANEDEGRVYGIDGSTGIIKWTSIPAGTSTWALIQLDDINGDGKRDVASGDFSGHIYFHNTVNGAQLKQLMIGNVIILRFEAIGDMNKDGYRDFLVAHSGTNAMIVDGFSASYLWTRTLADKCWTVTNMGDINRDGSNDVGAGTLFTNNNAYFLNGANGSILTYVGIPDPVDALHSIPDIVGDGTMEMLVGDREGGVYCFSGGFDPFVGRAESFPASQFIAQPNPCAHQLSVFYPEDFMLRILDISGRLIFQKEIKNSGERVIFNRSELNIPDDVTGMFLLEWKSAQGSGNCKIVFTTLE